MYDVLKVGRVAIVFVASVACAFLGLLEISMSGRPGAWAMTMFCLAGICGQRLFNWGGVSNAVELPQISIGVVGVFLCAVAYSMNADGRLMLALSVICLDFLMEVVVGRMEDSRHEAQEWAS